MDMPRGGAGVLEVGYTYTQTVYDSFPGSSLNTGLWTDPDNSVQVTVASGTLTIPIDHGSSGNEVEVDSTETWNLANGIWGIQRTVTGSPAATTDEGDVTGGEVYFGLWSGNSVSGPYIEIQMYPNAWYVIYGNVSGYEQTSTSTALGSAWVNGNWFGVGNYDLNGDGKFQVYSSPDGQNWTEQGAVPVGASTLNPGASGVYLGTKWQSGSTTWSTSYQDASFFARSPGGGGGGGLTLPYPLLGMYQTGGAFPTPGPSAWPSGPTTNMTAEYFAWYSGFETDVASFISECSSNSLLPYVELEPWYASGSATVAVEFTSITGGSYDTPLEAVGTAIASSGKPCILTFAHEMNVSGQYPWSQGDTGSGPGGGALTAAEWITGWAYVKAKVNSTANGLALWMWACSAFTGGTSISPAAYWPSSALPDMVGIDGYPSTQYGTNLGTFSGQIQPTVTIIRGLGWTSGIFISETNLAQMANGPLVDGTQYPPGESITSFVANMYTAGISGILEFEDATWDEPEMTSEQWDEYNAAIAANYGAPAGGTSGLLMVGIA